MWSKKNKNCDDLMDTDSGTDTDMSENNSRGRCSRKNWSRIWGNKSDEHSDEH